MCGLQQRESLLHRIQTFVALALQADGDRGEAACEERDADIENGCWEEVGMGIIKNPHTFIK